MGASLSVPAATTASSDNACVAMDQDKPTPVSSSPANTVTRITDVVPANFLCDTQALAKVAESKLLDEKELLALDDELSILEAHRQGLKDKLATVEQLVANMIAKQTRLRSSIATHATLLSPSPLRALPSEVLSEIFLYYVALFPPATRAVFEDIVACHRIQIPLLQVCRRWRSTALADPRLWTTIPLVGSAAARSRFAHPLISASPEERTASWQALEDRIERSSALPLNILFHLDASRKIGDIAFTVSSFETFIRLFPRASTISLYLQVFFRAVASVVDKAEISPAVAVHTASIDVDHKVLRRKILAAIPNVEILEINEVNIGQWLCDTPNVGHHLRSLHVHSAPLHLVAVLYLLDHAPLLDTLKLFRILEPTAGNDLHVVIHNVLSTFQLIVSSPRENDATFQYLTFPSLRYLLYSAEHHQELTWPRRSNIDFLDRSGCALTKLSFCHCNVNEILFVEMLQSQTDLTILEFNVLPEPRSILGHLPISMSMLDFLSMKRRGVSKRPVPAVEVIRFAILPRQLKRASRLVQSRFGDQARNDGVAELREVDVVVNMQRALSRVKKAEHEAFFEEFVKAGMNVKLSDGL